MANIEPFDYQERTNIEEHNQLVNKVNEIVEVINDTNLDIINSEIATLKSKATETDTEIANIKDKDSVQDTEISNIKDKDAIQDTEITNIKNKDAMQDTEITNIKNKDAMQDTEITNIKNKDAIQDTEIQGITKSLVSNVVLLSGTTTGNMKVRVEREESPSIDSNDYNIQKPVSVELIQGSASAMVKAQITLSDGTVLISDDFMFTTESIGTDVYISSFVFKNGNVAGTISADIGLSNGSTLTANNFVVPTDPNVLSSISDLQSRMTAIENSSGELTELKATVDRHTSSINELNTDVANLMTDKADVNNSGQSITAGIINATNINKNGVSVATTNDISGKVNIAQGTGNAGKVLGINASGNVEPTEISSGGEVWEEVNLSNFPTDWVNGDRIKINFKVTYSSDGGGAWTIKPTNAQILPPSDDSSICSGVHEFMIKEKGLSCMTSIKGYLSAIDVQVIYVTSILPPSNWNSSGTVLVMQYYAMTGAGIAMTQRNIDRSEISTFVNKMWRLKK